MARLARPGDDVIADVVGPLLDQRLDAGGVTREQGTARLFESRPVTRHGSQEAAFARIRQSVNITRVRLGRLASPRSPYPATVPRRTAEDAGALTARCDRFPTWNDRGRRSPRTQRYRNTCSGPVLRQVVVRMAGVGAPRHTRVCWDRLWRGKLAPSRPWECRSPVSGRSRPWHTRAAGLHAMVRQLGGRTDGGDRRLRAAPRFCPWRVAGPPWARAHPCPATGEFEPRGSKRSSS
jgi:hypothetical protein